MEKQKKMATLLRLQLLIIQLMQLKNAGSHLDYSTKNFVLTLHTTLNFQVFKDFPQKLRFLLWPELWQT